MLQAHPTKAAEVNAGAADMLASRNRDPNREIMLKGGTIISQDPHIGNIVRGDLIIRGSKIFAVGPELKSESADIIDVQNCIIFPGFVDAHRHAWSGQLRRINPNASTLAAYNGSTHDSFAHHYRPPR